MTPLLSAKHARTVEARVCLTQALPQQRDWSDAYKKDSDCNLILNHLSTSTKPFPPKLINAVHRCFCDHLRENRIKILNEKLVCYLPIGESNRLVMLIIVPYELRKLIALQSAIIKLLG